MKQALRAFLLLLLGAVYAVPQQLGSIPCCIIAINGGGGGSGITGITGDVLATGSGVVPATVVAVQGVLFSASPSINSTPVITVPGVSTWTPIPNCGDTTHALAFSTGTHLFSCQALSGGGGGTPGGLNTQLQYNNGGTFGGVADLTYVGTTLTLSASGTLDTHLGAFKLPASLATGIVVVTGGTGIIGTIVAPISTVVGISDTQTLTNKSIAGSEINSGVVSPTFGGTGANLIGSAGIVRSGNPFTSSELSGDATTSGSNVVTVLKINGVSHGTSPATDTTAVITAANTATYTAITNCGDATHALAYATSTHTFSCQSITGAAAAGGSNTQVQYNNAGALGGVVDYTWNGTHTLSSGAAGILDLHLAATSGLLLPGGLSTGILRVTTSTGAIASSELSGDATTNTSNVVTVLKVNGVSYTASPATDTAAIITAANTATYTAVTNCGDSTHALAYSTSTHTFSCQGITATATAGGSNTQLQYNNATALGGVVDFTWNGSHTLASGAAGILDLHLAATSGLLLPGGLSTGILRVTTSTGAIVSSELSGDVTTSGSNAATVLKVNGVSYSTSPATDTTTIITAANTATYTAITNCGDATHGLAYSTSTHTFSCQLISGSVSAGGSNGQVQYNNAGSLGGLADLTLVGLHTITLGASGILDLHLAPTAGLLLPGALSTGLVTVVTSTGAISSVAAPSGAVVGTTDSQTLTNKSINGSEINSGLVTSTFGGTGADLHLAVGIVRAGNPFTASELSGDATTSGSNIVTVLKVNGTTIPTNAAADQVIVTTASAVGAWKSIPVCTGTGKALTYDTATHAFGCNTISGGGTAFGATGDVWLTAATGQTIFTPGWAFTGTLMYVFVNGSVQKATVDYSVSGNTIVFSAGLVSGDQVRVTQ